MFLAPSCENGDYGQGNRAYIQVRINTTDYFLDPDNVGNDGIPGAASPYPRSTDFQPCFNLYPDVYDGENDSSGFTAVFDDPSTPVRKSVGESWRLSRLSGSLNKRGGAFYITSQVG